MSYTILLQDKRSISKPSPYKVDEAIIFLEAAGIQNPGVHDGREVWYAEPEDASKAKALRAGLLQKLQPVGGRLEFNAWHPEASRVLELSRKHSGYLDVEIEQNGIVAITRENGDVGEETPGAEDIRAIKAFALRMKEELPGIRPNFEFVDEWVSCEFSFDEMDGILPKSSPKPR